MSLPAAAFHDCDPTYLAKVAQALAALAALTKAAKADLEPDDWNHLCDRAKTLFKKNS